MGFPQLPTGNDTINTQIINDWDSDKDLKENDVKKNLKKQNLILRIFILYLKMKDEKKMIQIFKL